MCYHSGLASQQYQNTNLQQPCPGGHNHPLAIPNRSPRQAPNHSGGVSGGYQLSQTTCHNQQNPSHKYPLYGIYEHALRPAQNKSKRNLQLSAPTD